MSVLVEYSNFSPGCRTRGTRLRREAHSRSDSQGPSSGWGRATVSILCGSSRFFLL